MLKTQKGPWIYWNYRIEQKLHFQALKQSQLLIKLETKQNRTAEKTCPFISLMRHASMHVPLIMQRLFIKPLLLFTVAGWMGVISASDVCPFMPAFWCPVLDQYFFFYQDSFGERNRPQAIASSEGREKERTVKAEPRDHSDLWASYGLKTPGVAHHVLNIL